MNNSMEPMYPMPPGARVPELNLAGVDGWDSAAAMGVEQVMPTPELHTVEMPALSGNVADIEQLGVDADDPREDMNLAGVDGFPPPDELASGSGRFDQSRSPYILPDEAGYTGPDFSQTTLQSGDVSTGTQLNQVPEWQPDPSLPDLVDYDKPYGLNIMKPDIKAVDPVTGDLLEYDTPTGLMINHNPDMADPLVPDLQHPDLMPAADTPRMMERPGELASDALDVMDNSLTAKLTDDKSYPGVFMDARGYNSHRARHMTQLMDGLRAEEK